MDDFAAAARGAGVIPWRFDGDRFEEDIFHRAATVPAAQRGLSIDGCHRLARQFRGLVEAQQARAAAAVGRGQNCPFDLHTLLPVPDAILASARPIRTPWPGLPRTGASPTGCARSRCGPVRPRGTGYRGVTQRSATDSSLPGETPHAGDRRAGRRGFPPLRFALVPRPAD